MQENPNSCACLGTPGSSFHRVAMCRPRLPPHAPWRVQETPSTLMRTTGLHVIKRYRNSYRRPCRAGDRAHSQPAALPSVIPRPAVQLAVLTPSATPTHRSKGGMSHEIQSHNSPSLPQHL